MIKTLFKNTLLIMALCVYTNQKAMKKHKQKWPQIPKLKLITQKKIPGHICNINQIDNDYFVVLTKKDKIYTLELWDNKLNTQIDSINSKQILEALHIKEQISKFDESCIKDNMYQDMKKAKLKYYTSPSSKKGQEEIILEITLEGYQDYLVEYNLSKNSLSISELQNDNDYFFLTPKQFFSCKQYEILNWIPHRVTQSLTIEIKPNISRSLNETYPTTILPNPIQKIHVNLVHKDAVVEKVIGGEQNILVLQNNYSGGGRNTTLYSIKTGRAVIIDEKILDLKKIIQRNKTSKQIRHGLFGKKDSFIVIVCDLHSHNCDGEFQKQIILFDLRTYKIIGKYTLPQKCVAGFDNNIALRLSHNEKEIIVISVRDKQMYRFKNPLATINIDELERISFIQDQEGEKAKNEEEPFEIIINGFNGIRIPINKGLLLLG